MQNDAVTVIRKHLLPGEQLLWAGRPKQGFALRGWDIMIIPFSLLMILAGLSFLVFGVIPTREPLLLLFISLWTLGAVYFAFGRFFYDARKRARTYYGLTNARAIVVTGDSSYDFRAIQLNTLKEVTFTKRVDGTGTLEFDRPGFLSYRGRFDTARGLDWPWYSMDNLRTMAFEMIANPREVETLLRQAKETAKSGLPA